MTASTSISAHPTTAPARRAAHSDWAVGLGRAGLAARGVLYLTVAFLALQIARGEAAATADKQGALVTLDQQSFGHGLLIVTAIGLAAYAAWCLLKVFLVDEDSDAKQWAVRAGYAGRAVLYGSACVAAVSVLQSHPKASSGQKGESWTASVLGWPGGRLLVGAAGVAIIAAGLWNAYRAISRKFEDHLDRSAMSERTWKTVGAIAIGGLLGRFVAFVLVGWFVLRAAIDFRADEPIGLDQSLRTLQGAGAGPWLIGLTAFGLALFGVYSFAEARWRKLPE